MTADLDRLTPEEKRRLLTQLTSGAQPVVKRYPVSVGQECILGMEREQPGTCMFLIPIAFRTIGPLNVTAFRGALNEVVRRHESLRTTFRRIDSGYEQLVSPSLTHALPVEVVPGATSEQREQQLREVLQQEIQNPIDLVHGPVLRARLFRLDDDVHVFVLCFHRLITDSWSLGAFFLDLSTSYTAFCAGHPSPLTPLPLQFGAYVQAQQAAADRATRERTAAFWRDRLRGLRPIEWPGGRHSQNIAGEAWPVVLPEDVVTNVTALSRAVGTTPFAVALAGYIAVMHGFTGQRDLWVSTPAMSNRDRADTECLIGLLGNLLVLRVQISPEMSFRNLVKQIGETALQAMENQEVSLLDLAQAAGVARFGGLSSLGRIVFAYQSSPQPEFKLLGLTLQFLPTHTGQTGSELALSLFRWGGHVVGTIEHRSDVISAETARQLGQGYVEALRAGTSQPDHPVASLARALAVA